ncbi:MAG TPA: N-6 DNA methylase [Pyrinomonadaceae bacterium]|jgi:type I restriction-modification system DNA methylase subunit
MTDQRQSTMMTRQRDEHVHDFRQKVRAANKEATKKEAFKDLLNRLYAGDDETRRVIDSISGGAEAAIVNIPRQDKLHRGSADTLYNQIIIEFENDLKKSLAHAKDQLAGYLLGQFKSGAGYNFTLIASDFINWKVFAPDVFSLDKLHALEEDELGAQLKEVESASFTLSEHNAEEFYYWIDRFLFKGERQKATLKRVEESFGYQSRVFIQCFGEMTAQFRVVKESGEVQVSFEQWKRFLSIAYGSFVPSEQNFLVHTYLSVFAKLLAYTVVSNDEYIDDANAREIIDGSAFHRYSIGNFVENDFFHWIASEQSFPTLKKVFRLLTQELSAFDFRGVDEDILKGIYQEMIDLDTRHALGEYYTPDWLCERVVDEFEFKSTDKILDPSCGSGSFLRAVIARIKRLHPHVKVEDLNDQIYGIDIHPLSVQIAKTTLLLALGREVVTAKKPVHLNIMLANTLLAPQGVETLYGNEFLMQIDKDRYSLSTQIFDNMHLFDEALNVCEELAEQTLKRREEKLPTFANILKNRARDDEIKAEVAESFYQIYLGLKSVKEQGRDSIWKFIVQNLYKPYFLSEKFDFVVGNPPWFTYSSIRNEDYQDILDKLAKEYDVKPERKANFPHLEIAAIFLAYCSSYFLRAGGRIAFVLPRSFFSADHHDNTRSGKAKGFALTAAWDLNAVAPLFRVPSCVLFAEKSKTRKALPASGLKGRSLSGKIPAHNCNLKRAAPQLTEENVQWFYVQRGKTSALSTTKPAGENKPNPYKQEFKQGATIVPRAFYFIDINQPMPPDFEDRLINIRTSASARADAKKPWTDIDLKGRIESRFLFRTALSKSVLPFALFNPSLVALPITIHQDSDGSRWIELRSAEELMKEGYLDASSWFAKAGSIWEQRRTERNQTISAEDYLNWQNKLTEQNLNAQHLILYNSSAQDANATVVKRADLDFEFIADHKAYIFASYNEDEAYYLTAILNSSAPNKMMKDFQSRGLFGARDIHKKILDIYFPRFDGSDATHLLLAHLSATAHERAAQFLRDNPPEGDLTPGRLGRLRASIKKHVEPQLMEIDTLVEKIVV